MKKVPAMRVKVPCDDEGDFYARLADHVAEHGLRVPSQTVLPVGDRLRMTLEFRDGGTLSGEAMVSEHVPMGDLTGLIVRFVRFDRSAADGAEPAVAARKTPASSFGDEPASESPEEPPLDLSAPPDLSQFDTSPFDLSAPDLTAPDTSAPDPFDGDLSPSESAFGMREGVQDEAGMFAPPPKPRGVTLPSRAAELAGRLRRSLEKGGAAIAGAARRTTRAQRIAGAIAAAAVLLGGALGYALSGIGTTPEEAAAAHLSVAERKLVAGHVTGNDGALEHLLEAKRLAPGNPKPEERLSHLADVLEKLGSRALRRGDLEVASIHLEGAQLAAPDRPSVREKLDALAKARQSPRPSRRR